MIGIVERLRERAAEQGRVNPFDCVLDREAADEIERLRALLLAHDECSTIDQACGHDAIWTQRFRKLVAETRDALGIKA